VKFVFLNCPCSVSFTIHRTVVIYSVPTQQHTYSLSVGLNCRFHFCGTTAQYGWGFTGFWNLQPFDKTPWARCVAKSVPVIQVACRFVNSAGQNGTRDGTVGALEGPASLWSAYCALNTRNCHLVRVNVTLNSLTKVLRNTNIQKNNELIRMIGRSAASADSIMLNPLKTEFSVSFVSTFSSYLTENAVCFC